MIWRVWRGLAISEVAEDYVEHLHRETFASLANIDGFEGAHILRRPAGGGEEFLVITQWRSVESINAFAGDDAEAAVVPQKVQDMMMEFDDRARHYRVV